MQLFVRCKPDGVTHYVSLKGEIDIATVPRLRQRLLDCIEQGALFIVLDMTGVSFCDAAGIGLLVMLHKRALLQIRITDTQFLWRLIRMCSLEKVLDIQLGP